MALIQEHKYRGWIIYYDPPPIPDRRFDWHFYHEDYDGAPDGNDDRHGDGPTLRSCFEQIDNYIKYGEW